MSDLGVAAMRRVHIVSFASDGTTRTLSLPRCLLVGSAALKLTLILWAAFSLYLLMFRDTLVGKLISDQEQMRAAYEEKLAAERQKLDDSAIQEASARESFEGRLRELLSRQAQLETRTESVAQLLRGGHAELTSAHAHPGSVGASIHATSGGQSANIGGAPKLDPLKAIAEFTGQKPRPIEEPPAISSYAEQPSPLASSSQAQALDRMAPPRPGLSATGAPAPDANAQPLDAAKRESASSMADPVSIATISDSLDKVERLQVETLKHASSNAAVAVDRMRGALRNSGLDPARLGHVSRKGARNTGGPFMALPKGATGTDASNPNFDSILHGLRVRLEEHDELSRIIALLPIRSPLQGQLEITSPYGARKDPFGMGWALHPGVDLRAEEGAIVRATAPGKVVNAAYAGGYGNMVEIEHAEGVNTRYGHLSAILVSDGQTVAAGTPIGRVGSTGRSTGPHLHYETRIDGEPVDPMRFLNSSEILRAAASGGVD